MAASAPSTASPHSPSAPTAVAPSRQRIAVVTGGASGLGLQISLDLARTGATVVVVGRDAARLARVREEIDRAVGRPATRTIETSDLALLPEVKRVGELLARSLPEIDILVNNAGGVFAPRELTADGLERTFALNVVAPYVLTTLLLPSLARAAPSRVVNIASAAHRFQHLDFDDLGLARRYSAMRAYARSKLALILLTREFARRLEGSGVSVFAVHPGFVRTHFGQNNRGGLGAGLKLASLLFAIEVARGAESPVFAATDRSLNGRSGLYIARRLMRPGSAASRDLTAAARLFEACRTISGSEMAPFGRKGTDGSPAERAR